MKKIVSLVLVAVMLFALTSCGNKPEKALEDMFKALKAGDIAKLAELSGGNADDMDIPEEMEKVVKALYAGMTYKVGKAEVKDDKATVEVEITLVNMADVAAKATTEALKHIGDSDWDAQKYMIDLINDKDTKTTTHEIKVPMELKDGKWVIDEDGKLDDLINAFSGSLGDSIG